MSITSKNLVLGPTDQKPGLDTWYSTLIEERKIDNLKPNEVIVQLSHVGFNHRDKWIRQGGIIVTIKITKLLTNVKNRTLPWC